MKYFWLGAEDVPSLNMLFFYDDAAGYRRVAERYLRFRCHGCHKLDSLKCLESGIDPALVVESPYDWWFSWDDMLCVSHRVVWILRDAGVHGFRTFDIPSDDRFVVVWIDLRASVDTSEAEFRFHRPKCGICNRWREVTWNVESLHGITPPRDEMMIFAPEILPESSQSQRMNACTTEKVVSLLRDEGVTGMLPFEMSK